MNSFNNHTRPADSARCPAPEIAADLKAYADNELTVLRRRIVTNHLRRCAACRTEITAMTRIAGDIKTADAGSAAPLNPDLRQRLLERMGAEAPSVPTARTLPLWRRKPLLIFGGGAAYAAVFLLLAAALLLTFGTAREKARQASFASLANLRDDELKRKLKGYPSYDETFPAELVMGRQVHREGSVTVAVDKLEAASDKVEQMVKASGGFVASNNLATDSDGYKSADLSVRVPVEQFDDMLRQFAALGTVTAKSISGEDITERVSDATQAEQVLKDATQTAVRKLKNENGSEKEIRYREADLRRVKIEFAQTQARLGLLRKMARLSTINVSLTEKAKRAAQAPSQGGFLGDLSETNRMVSAAFASAIRVPVVLIIWGLAFSPLWVPMLVFYRYAFRRGLRELG